MAIRQTYHCDCCGTNINDHDTPVLFYMVAGTLDGPRELTRGEVPALVQHVLTQPIPRIELHAHCVPKYLAHWLDEEARQAEWEAEAAAQAPE